LEKPFRIQELCDNIQKAIRLEEEKWRAREQKNKADRRLDNLTQAEREVMQLVVAGKTNKTIAAELDLSIRAVEDRRARMMRKLRVKSRAELLELVTMAQLPSNTMPRQGMTSVSLPENMLNLAR
jgi:FixJ family two-component response regulator